MFVFVFWLFAVVPIIRVFHVGSLFYGVVRSVHSRFATSSLRKRALIILFICILAIEWLSIFGVFYLRCLGLVCGLCVWDVLVL